MKMVYCSYEHCGTRRLSWSSPYTPRGTQKIQVADEHKGPMFCSFECAIYAGVMTVNEDGKGKIDPATLPDAVQVIEDL